MTQSHGDGEKKPAEDTEERITILSKDFTPAAMEFHRRRLGEQGYSIEGRITRHTFYLAEETGETAPMFDGEPYYAVTFFRKK